MQLVEANYYKRFVLLITLLLVHIMCLQGCSAKQSNQVRAIPAKEESISGFSKESSSSAPKITTLKITAVGDVNPGSKDPTYVRKNGYPYLNIRNLFRSDDLTFGNLECCLSYRGSPAPGKQFTFRGAPESAHLLKEAGFDIMSVANNHSKDFGSSAFLDTLMYLRLAGVHSSGGGINITEAIKPAIINTKERKVAFIAFSDIIPYDFAATSSRCGLAPLWDTKLVLDSVKKARDQADIVVVSLHWGQERATYPSSDQTKLAHQIIDSGADIILGHHPHVIQGIEIYKGKLIAYSLGNFMFSPGNFDGRKTVILTTKIDKGKINEIVIYPVFISDIRPHIMGGKEAAAWLTEISKRSSRFKTSFKLENLDKYLVLHLTR
ncbi:MAG: CapA family protein [Actinomycetota bacterium]|nr:CapA family protein [Actinomycetota bacterium]